MPQIQIEDRVLISRVVRNGIRVFTMRKRTRALVFSLYGSELYLRLKKNRKQMKYSNRRGRRTSALRFIHALVLKAKELS